MKTTITLILAMLGLCLYGNAQSIARSTVGSAGSTVTVVANNKTYFVSQSIGQASIIGTSTSNGYTIRQGFQQPPSSIIISKPLPGNGLSANIYPNPFSQSVQVALESKVNQNVTIVMHDLTGRIILNRNYAPSQLIELSLKDIANGDYIISVLTGQKRFTTSIIKQ